MPDASLLRLTAERLSPCELAFATMAEGEGWELWREAVATDRVAELHAAVAAGTPEHGPIPAACAAVSLVGDLTWLLVAVGTAAILRERRCPDLGPANVLLHRSEDGTYDRLAVDAPRVAVLPDDPGADDADAVVLADLDELHDWFAEHLAECLRPLVTGVRAQAKLGPPALWGGVADAVCIEGMWAACGEDETLGPAEAAWRETAAMVEALAAREPAVRTRPAAVHVVAPTGPVLRVRRGVCCLWYRTPEAIAEPDPAARKCSNCPLRNHAEQVAAWERELAS